MLLTLEPLLARSPFLVLHVRRSNLVGDALRELSIHSDIDLKKPLKVSFPHVFSTLSFSKYFCSLSAILITTSPECSSFSIGVAHRNTWSSHCKGWVLFLTLGVLWQWIVYKKASTGWTPPGVLSVQGPEEEAFYDVSILPVCRNRLFTVGCVLSLKLSQSSVAAVTLLLWWLEWQVVIYDLHKKLKFSKYLICHLYSLSVPAGRAVKWARGLSWVWACGTNCFACLPIRERFDSLSLRSAPLSLTCFFYRSSLMVRKLLMLEEWQRNFSCCC